MEITQGYKLVGLTTVADGIIITNPSLCRTGSPDTYKSIALGYNANLKNPYATWESDGKSMYNIRCYIKEKEAIEDYRRRFADAKEGR